MRCALQGGRVALPHNADELAATFGRLGETLIDDLAEHRPIPIIKAAQELNLRWVERVMEAVT